MQNNPSKILGKQGKGLSDFQVVERECVWMKAGVINFRACDKDYDCHNCPFDRAMRSAMDAQHPPRRYAREIGWAETMRRKYPGTSKPCRYLLTGEMSPPAECPRNYDCDGCPVELELGYGKLRESIEVARYARELRSTKSFLEKREGLQEERLPGFQVLDHECVWMKAGIVTYRSCDGDFDCYHCDFDRSMREAMAEKEVSGSQAPLQDSKRKGSAIVVSPCIHYLAGRTEAPAECKRAYECYRCPVHDVVPSNLQLQPVPLGKPRYRYAAGYKVAEDYYYHFGHTWVQILHGECVRVGFDDFAGRIFGIADAIEAQQSWMSMKQGEVGYTLIRDSNVAPVLFPLSGRVLAMNRKALEHPEVLFDDPYHEGWLFQLEPYRLKQEIEGLYCDEECHDWMEQEHRRLLQLLGPGHEGLASTGGEPITDVIGHFPSLGWDRLVRSFLRTVVQKA